MTVAGPAGAGKSSTDGAPTGPSSHGTAPLTPTDAGGGTAGSPPRAAPDSRRAGPGFLTLLLGGVLAGGIGYLAATYLDFGPNADDEDLIALAQQLNAQEEAIATLRADATDAGADAGVDEEAMAALQAETAALRTALATLADEFATAPDGSDAASEPRGPDPDIDRIAQELAALGAAVAALEAGPSGSDGTTATAAEGDADGGFAERLSQIEATLGAQIQEAEASLGERLSQIETSQTAQGDAIAALEDTVATRAGAIAGIEETLSAQGETLAQVQDVQAAQDEAIAAARTDASEAAEQETRRVSAAAAVARIDAAVQSGAPYVDALGALESTADVAIPDLLRDAAGEGVPTVAELAARFPPLARDALAASVRATAGGGIGDRFGAFLRAQTGARSLGERPGADPDAILSRAEARLDEGELAAALDELEALPHEGREVLAFWLTDARERLAAGDAVAALSQSLSVN